MRGEGREGSMLHQIRERCNVHSQASPVFVLWFVFSIIHGSGRAAKTSVPPAVLLIANYFLSSKFDVSWLSNF